MRQTLLISIWLLSAILLLTSSSLKLCQVGWGQTHTFRFLQKYLIGFKLSLWLGHSRTFTELSLAVCLGPLSCWKVNLLRFWMLWTGITGYLNILVHWAFLLFWWVPQSLPLKNSPIPWGCYSTLYFWDGTLQVMSSAGYLQTWSLELRFIRPDPIIYQSLRVL